MKTILLPVVSSKLTNTVSLWKLIQPSKQVSQAKTPSITDLRQKIIIAALLIRDKRYPQAKTEKEQQQWQQAYDCLLVALHMLKQAECTPRHAVHCFREAEALFCKASELAGVEGTLPITQINSENWIG